MRIANRAVLETFAAEWHFHHSLDAGQLNFAGRTATVESVSYYHGGDELYTLTGVPGVWHACCLMPI